jgi:hypothetical protein
MRLTKSATLCSWLLAVALLVLLVARNGIGQTKDVIASDLVKSLTKPTSLEMLGLSSCGSFTVDQGTARSLAKLGHSAVPEIEGALVSIEEHGEQSSVSFKSAWLLLAFARIQPPDRFPRLRRMLRNPKLGFLIPDIDRAIALSLTLTSYVSVSRSPTKVIHCDRSPEPRDALDQMILAWERNDRPLLEARLGPRARAAINLLLKQKNSWAGVRAELSPGRHPDDGAIGYRFDISGHWSEPDETLEEKLPWGDSAVVSEQREFSLLTFFKDSFGKDCGQYNVKFLKISAGRSNGVASYLIDNSDLDKLLRLVESCATRTK